MTFLSYSRSPPTSKPSPPISSLLPMSSGATRSSTATDVRLPSDVLPTHYDIKLTPDIYGPDPTLFRFEGRVNIHLNCTIGTDVIVLHAKQLDVDNSSSGIVLSPLSMSDGPAPAVRDYEWDSDREFLKVRLGGMLRSSRQYLLQISYSGALGDDMNGFYRSSYADGNVTK